MSEKSSPIVWLSILPFFLWYFFFFFSSISGIGYVYASSQMASSLASESEALSIGVAAVVFLFGMRMLRNKYATVVIWIMIIDVVLSSSAAPAKVYGEQFWTWMSNNKFEELMIKSGLKWDFSDFCFYAYTAATSIIMASSSASIKPLSKRVLK